MFITITSSHLVPEKSKQVDDFLRSFLPRMRKLPGVVAIYHFERPEKGDENTLVIWESQAAAQAYREGDLVKEVLAFEKQIGMVLTREGYPVLY